MVMMKNTRITALLVAKLRYDVIVVMTQVTNSVAADRIPERDMFPDVVLPPDRKTCGSIVINNISMIDTSLSFRIMYGQGS